VEKAFGDKVKTTYVENVPEGADAERVIRELAVSGHKLIFSTSFGFMNATVKVAKQYPDVKFEHATGYQRAPNLATYMARFYESRYPAGIAAGRLTRTHKLGYIAPFPIPEIVRSINAFALGARSVDPKAEVRVVWVNSWYDPGKEREAAEALIAQGVDVVAQQSDSAAPVQAAERAGFGRSASLRYDALRSARALTSCLEIWSGYYIDRVRCGLEGTGSRTIPGGFQQGHVASGAVQPGDAAAVKSEAL
jgi:simple sugar transport system substrate-binding protein